MERNKCDMSYNDSINCILINKADCKDNKTCHENCTWDMLGNSKYDEVCDIDKCFYDLGDSYYSLTEKQIFVSSKSSINLANVSSVTYNSLSLALKHANRGKTIIYLQDASYKLDEDFTYLKKQFFQNLTIKPLFCNVYNISPCFADGKKSEIILGNLFSNFLINANVIFENIIWFC